MLSLTRINSNRINSLLVATGLALASMTAATQNLSSSSSVPDEDGILSIKQKPFDPNNFVVSQDLWTNKFDDQQRDLKYSAECFFNLSSVLPDGAKQVHE